MLVKILGHRNLTSSIVETLIIELALTFLYVKCSISGLKVDSILLTFEIKFLNALGNGTLLLLLFNVYSLILFLSLYPYSLHIFYLQIKYWYKSFLIVRIMLLYPLFFVFVSKYSSGFPYKSVITWTFIP